jgi:hypothetical protein
MSVVPVLVAFHLLAVKGDLLSPSNPLRLLLVFLWYFAYSWTSYNDLKANMKQEESKIILQPSCMLRC